MRLPRRSVAFLVFVGSMLLAMACGGDGGPNQPGAPLDDDPSSERPCVDADGDGFGLDCADGPDCDDADDTLFEGCGLCSTPDEGCPCDAGELPVVCELDPAQVPKDTVLCKDGLRYCRDGAWTGCMGVAMYVD
jgi:hypothetical protein